MNDYQTMDAHSLFQTEEWPHQKLILHHSLSVAFNASLRELRNCLAKPFIVTITPFIIVLNNTQLMFSKPWKGVHLPT